MFDWKVTVDILTSYVSLVAIVIVLVTWYRSSIKPLKIERVVIYRKPDERTYVITFINRKNYPVTIKSISCHTKIFYNIKKRPRQRPEYSELLNLSDNLFRNEDENIIDANGRTDIEINENEIASNAQKLLFAISTSHGYYELWCENPLYVEYGKGENYELEYSHDFDSKLKAKWMYFLCLVKSILKIS